MANTVTKTERTRILCRDQALLRQNPNAYNAHIDTIQREFNISRERARSAVAKALRISRRPTK